MLEPELAERVTLVTGAGRGIGAAIARRFAAAGSNLVLAARNRDQLEEVARAARELRRTVLVLPVDLSDPAAAEYLVGETVSKFGRLGVLINNAGGAAPRPFLETTAQDLLDAFQLNVAASFELTKQAVPHLLEREGASVITLTSRMDRLVARGLLTYGTVKAATTQMTRLLAAEVRPTPKKRGHCWEAAGSLAERTRPAMARFCRCHTLVV